jgi:hypothetical protein
MPELSQMQRSFQAESGAASTNDSKFHLNCERSSRLNVEKTWEIDVHAIFRLMEAIITARSFEAGKENNQ